MTAVDRAVLPPTNDTTQIPPPPTNVSSERARADITNASWDILSLGRRSIVSSFNFARHAIYGTIGRIQHFAAENLVPAIAQASQEVSKKTVWTFGQVQLGLESIDVINMALKTFNSSMKILRDVQTPLATKIHTDLHAVNELFANTTKILNIPSTFKKVSEISKIMKGQGADNKIGDLPNYLKLVSQVSLLGSDIIGHFRTLVDTKLADAKWLYREIFRIESYGHKTGINLDKMQAGLSVTGFGFGLAENVRKIAGTGQIQLANGLSGLGNIAKITSVVAANMRYAGMPIVSAAANIVGNVIGIANYYVKQHKLEETTLLRLVPQVQI